MTINMLHSIKKLPITCLLGVAALALFCLGCGKMGDPIPPSGVATSENSAHRILLPEKRVVLQPSVSEKMESKTANKAKAEFK